MTVSLPAGGVARPVTVAMLFAAVAVMGLVCAFRLPIDLLPDIVYPRLVVYTTWQGVGPQEMERLVSEPIERAASRVAGVERVESVSREGVSLVTLRFAWGADMDFAALSVREQLDNLRDALPELADRPAVLRTDPTAQPIVAIGVTGREIWALRDLAEAVFERRMEQIDGIAQAVVTGGLEREIQVDVDPRALESYGIEVADVAGALAAANVSVPGGTVRRGRYRYPLRTVGEFERVPEIGDVVIEPQRDAASGAAPPGVIRVSDIATVTDGWRERTSITRFNGREGVGLLLYKESGANTVRVTEEVEDVLAQLRSEHPDVQLEVATSQAGFISASISNVVSALIGGAVLAFLVLFLFLGDPRYPIAVALSIPISVIATFAVMDVFGVTLNIMSLAGLALGVGMLFDNSIVVLDNIERTGEPVRGTEEVQNAVVAVTLTTIVVFVPVVYVEGVSGALLRDVAITVSVSLMVSLLVALTLIPTLAARWIRRPMRVPLLERFRTGFGRLAERHHAVLERALDRPGRVLALTAGALALALPLGFTLDRAVLPDVDQGTFQVRLELPLGTPLERTSRVAAAMEQALRDDEDVAAVFTRIGPQEAAGVVEERRTSPGSATLDVRLRAGGSTDATLERNGAAIRRAAGNGTVTIESGSATPLAQFLGGGEADVVVGVRGESYAQVEAYAERLRAALTDEGALTDVRLGVETGQPEVRVEIDRDAVVRYGLDVQRVAAAIEAWMQGSLATDFVDFDRRVPVWVRLPESERRSLASLELLRVDGVPLRELVTTETLTGAAELRRTDQASVLPVLADIAEGGIARAVEAVERALEREAPPRGVRVEIGGASEEVRRSFLSVTAAFVIALLLVYMIIAAQFESFAHPLVIMATVPLAAIGAIAALWLTRAGLNAMSLIGVVILVGIVVDNSIVEIDFINQSRAQGTPLRQAILDAGRARLRPIVMSSATTILGTLPLALGFGSGAALRAPMAIAVVGGLAVSTALTLLVVPVLYERVELLRGKG